MEKKEAEINEAPRSKPAWNPEYKRGSTMFKPTERDDPKGYRCKICSEFYEKMVFDTVFEAHEIMHLLQMLVGQDSHRKDLVFF